MFKQMTIALAAVALFAVSACNQDPTSSTGGSNELVLAQNAQSIANSIAATPGTGTTWEGWVRRLLDTLRTTDDPEARAFLDSARMNRDSAWAAWQRGDTAAARAFRGAAFRDVLSAVIELFPNAPEPTGAALGTAIARLQNFPGDRGPSRNRAILCHAKDLRT